MIVIFTRLRANPGRRDELLTAFDDLHDAVAQEPGTLVFAMHASDAAPDEVLFYEVYADDDALAVHRASHAVRDVVPHLEGLLAGPPEITYATPRRSKGLPA